MRVVSTQWYRGAEVTKKNVYLVVAPSQYQLAATFMRFQEHYESPYFRKKIFSVEEYMDWYARKRGNFTYYKDWSGFNIPSWVLAPFYEGKFDPLLEKERVFLKLFSGIQDKFY